MDSTDQSNQCLNPSLDTETVCMPTTEDVETEVSIEPHHLTCDNTQPKANFDVIYNDLQQFTTNHKVEDVMSMDELCSDIFDEDIFQNEHSSIVEDLMGMEDDHTSDVEDDNEDCQDEEEDEENADDVIYPGHFLPVKVSVLLIWLYAINHSITGAQLSDLLTLIGFHCILPHPALRSLYRFKRYFVNVKSPLVRHYYCNFCLTCVDKDAKNAFCSKDFTDSNKKSYFIEVPIEQQLQRFFERDDFIGLLSKRFTRVKKRENSIEDIYDCGIYRSLSDQGGPLSDNFPYNISFTINTDGVPVFKSSKMSIWPIYLMITPAAEVMGFM